MPRRGSIRKKAKATLLDVTARLPRDVLAGIFLRLPANDLRRFRRVCKEWREVISDPAFVVEHLDHGPQALTHTIVFFPGSSPIYRAKFPNNFRDIGAKQTENGAGYLLDEHWRVTARFTVSESEDMVGTCNGLLCFLDVLRDAINIVEPFTSESLALPLPPKTERLHEAGAYCFGFDPGSRRYKIFHLGLDSLSDDTPGQDLFVYTIGGGENWRRVHIAGMADADVYYSDPVFADGSLYWSFHMDHQFVRLARFDLATEEITSMSIVDFLPVDGWGTALNPMADSDARIGVMTVGRLGWQDVFFMGEGGRWTRNSCSGVRLPQGLHLAWPQSLQRGHLLLQDHQEGGLYAHPIPAARNNDLGSGKLLLKRGKEKNKMPAKITNRRGEKQIGKEKKNTRGLFVPALSNKVPEMVGRVPQEWRSLRTFCYAPPVLPAPFAHRCGFPCGSPQPLAKKQKYK